MKLSPNEVVRIEEATRDQSENELWFALRNRKITSSKFGEILHRGELTDSRRLVRDLMGYGDPCETYHHKCVREGKMRIKLKSATKKLTCCW